jgi:hypothetical protein
MDMPVPFEVLSVMHKGGLGYQNVITNSASASPPPEI